MMPLLEVRGLTKHFGGVKALEEVTFRVKDGSITSIIGPNGAGKTTLFNCLTGLSRPTRGSVFLNGQSIAGLPPHSIVKSGIARTFQNIRLFREMTALENVMVSQHLQMRSGLASILMKRKSFIAEETAVRQKALEYLELVGIGNKAVLLSGNLPYGDQRRLEIARALATEPHLLLLDEPTAGMNPQETVAVMGTILKLRSLGKTVILIEHDMRVVMEISDTIVVLDHGVKIAEGTPTMVRNDPLVIEAYLGRSAFA